MIRRVSLVVAATSLAFVVARPVAQAEIRENRSVVWQVRTESSQAHPKLYRMAYFVTETIQPPRSVTLDYSCERYPESDSPEISAGGKISVHLRIVREGGTVDLGRASSKCRKLNTHWKYCFVEWELSDLELVAGDLILWEVKFRKMPKLRAEPDIYLDEFVLTGGIW